MISTPVRATSLFRNQQMKQVTHIMYTKTKYQWNNSMKESGHFHRITINSSDCYSLPRVMLFKAPNKSSIHQYQIK